MFVRPPQPGGQGPAGFVWFKPWCKSSCAACAYCCCLQAVPCGACPVAPPASSHNRAHGFNTGRTKPLVSTDPTSSHGLRHPPRHLLMPPATKALRTGQAWGKHPTSMRCGVRPAFCLYVHTCACVSTCVCACAENMREACAHHTHNGHAQGTPHTKGHTEDTRTRAAPLMCTASPHTHTLLHRPAGGQAPQLRPPGWHAQRPGQLSLPLTHICMHTQTLFLPPPCRWSGAPTPAARTTRCWLVWGRASCLPSRRAGRASCAWCVLACVRVHGCTCTCACSCTRVHACTCMFCVQVDMLTTRTHALLAQVVSAGRQFLHAGQPNAAAALQQPSLLDVWVSCGRGRLHAPRVCISCPGG